VQQLILKYVAVEFSDADRGIIVNVILVVNDLACLNAALRCFLFQSNHITACISVGLHLFKSLLLLSHSSSSRIRVICHNWSATKQRPHPQSVAEIIRHSVSH